MKFVPILVCLVIFGLLASCLTLRFNLRSHNTHKNGNNLMDFKDATNNENPSKVTTLEDVIIARPTTILAKSNENTRFKERESLERFERNMETPVIIKASPVEPTFQDVRKRVAMDTPQTITNNEAFDIVYKDHKSYYDDKKYIIFDKNFQKTEDYLLGEFANAVNSNLVLDQNLVHVDDYKRKGRLNIDLTTAPKVIKILNKITRENVGNTLQAKEYGFGQNDTQVTVSDPYNQIFNPRK